MSSSLTSTTLIIYDTQPITGIKTTLDNSNSEVPTSRAVINSLSGPVSLMVVGNWLNRQVISTTVDTTGLIFLATLPNGNVMNVTPDVSPSSWGSTAGTQIATFTYTENGVNLTTTKSASVKELGVAITFTNPNSGLVFRSITGNLYTDPACRILATTNTKYTGTVFYYNGDETAPTGIYLYDYGDGEWDSILPSASDLTTFYNEGSLTACIGSGSTEACWSGTIVTGMSRPQYYYIQLYDGVVTYMNKTSNVFHRVMQLSF